jgi:DNA polymerase
MAGKRLANGESDWTELPRSLRARLELDANLGIAFLPDPDGVLARWLRNRRPEKAAGPARIPAAGPPPANSVPPSPGRPSPPEAPDRPGYPVRPVPLSEAPENPVKTKALDACRREASECRRCELAERRNSVVWGEGDLDARLMFIGEAPGRDEDLEGRPFVGMAGRLLTDMIEKGLGFPRSRVYIANVVKCRPPGNRDPKPEEIRACSAYLERQIAVVAPRIIVAVGMVSGRFLLDLPADASGIRKQWWQYRGIPLRVIYHPSYLLRERRRMPEPGMRTRADRETWEDLKEILARLAAVSSDNP